MFFELNGKTLGVKFSRIGTSTFAELFRVEEDGFTFPGLMGTAYLHKNDRFVKSTGRKVALASLLNRMEEVSAGETEPEYVLSKEDRRAIWNRYFETHKK